MLFVPPTTSLSRPAASSPSDFSGGAQRTGIRPSPAGRIIKLRVIGDAAGRPDRRRPEPVRQPGPWPCVNVARCSLEKCSPMFPDAALKSSALFVTTEPVLCRRDKDFSVHQQRCGVEGAGIGHRAGSRPRSCGCVEQFPCRW